jgi:hypothetical protein
VSEGFALDELEHEKARGVRLLEAVEHCDAGVVECRQGSRLTLEARESTRVPGKLLGQDLERHLTPETHVAGAVHLAHATRAQQRQHLVAAELPSRQGADLLARQLPSGLLERGLLDEALRCSLLRQQRFELPTQRQVPLAGRFQEALSLVRLALEGRVVQLLEPLPALGPHGPAPG